MQSGSKIAGVKNHDSVQEEESEVGNVIDSLTGHHTLEQAPPNFINNPDGLFVVTPRPGDLLNFIQQNNEELLFPNSEQLATVTAFWEKICKIFFNERMKLQEFSEKNQETRKQLLDQVDAFKMLANAILEKIEKLKTNKEQYQQPFYGALVSRLNSYKVQLSIVIPYQLTFEEKLAYIFKMKDKIWYNNIPSSVERIEGLYQSKKLFEPNKLIFLMDKLNCENSRKPHTVLFYYAFIQPCYRYLLNIVLCYAGDNAEKTLYEKESTVKINSFLNE
ncbi:MAG TPA: hypothetical protein VHZ76_00330, partial [Gammaproteobacteria bacterium]|nr:hypothetical protein [Gammaproteobacteria bacterium]